jgi:hypothetical protein
MMEQLHIREYLKMACQMERELPLQKQVNSLRQNGRMELMFVYYSDIFINNKLTN